MFEQRECPSQVDLPGYKACFLGSFERIGWVTGGYRSIMQWRSSQVGPSHGKCVRGMLLAQAEQKRTFIDVFSESIPGRLKVVVMLLAVQCVVIFNGAYGVWIRYQDELASDPLL